MLCEEVSSVSHVSPPVLEGAVDCQGQDVDKYDAPDVNIKVVFYCLCVTQRLVSSKCLRCEH